MVFAVAENATCYRSMGSYLSACQFSPVRHLCPLSPASLRVAEWAWFHAVLNLRVSAATGILEAIPLDPAFPATFVTFLQTVFAVVFRIVVNLRCAHSSVSFSGGSY